MWKFLWDGSFAPFSEESSAVRVSPIGTDWNWLELQFWWTMSFYCQHFSPWRPPSLTWNPKMQISYQNIKNSSYHIIQPYSTFLQVFRWISMFYTGLIPTAPPLHTLRSRWMHRNLLQALPALATPPGRSGDRASWSASWGPSSATWSTTFHDSKPGGIEERARGPISNNIL